jgi:protein involved in polysaccharide export with SLBB domain
MHKGSTTAKLLLALGGLTLAGASVGAQATVAQSAAVAPASQLETRDQLEAEARTAEQQNRTSEAWLLRTRLQRGDFQEGDRIVVTLLGSATFNDTISVRVGKQLPLPRMGEVPLEGVLRSELESRISTHLAKFLRDSSVRAVPLVRLAVLGRVQRPGFYYTSADVLLSDMLMKAGGPAGDADLSKVSIRRGGETIWNAQDTRTAMSDGLSLERLHLRAGDEIYVAEEKHTNWMGIAQIGITLLGAAVALTQLAR